ncbi:hypothetical protein Btru_051040 [Bulinus truncatus]|nr:hypothetical protein Btru_051040 [Bulinus truncatus]
MSGSSTLRICLAAMAPALTEAASARLKLQDSSAKNESLSLIKVDKKPNEENLSFSKVDLHTANIRNKTRTTSHLLLSKSEIELERITTNGTCFDPKRSIPLGNASPQTISIPPNISTFSSIKTLNLKVSQIDKLYASEDFQDRKGAKSDQYIDNSKIMSQPHTAASKHIEQSKSYRSVEGGDNILSTSCAAKAKLLPPVMVNGESEINRKTDIGECDERGNCFFKNGIQLNSENRTANLNTESKLLNTSLKMGIDLKPDQSLTRVIMDDNFKSESVVNEKSKEEMRKDCMKKQVYFERKVDILLRRLKRMKGKVVETHAKEQLKHFIKFQYKNLQNVAKAIKNETPGPAELKEHFLSNEDVKNMSAAQLVKLVKNYQPNRLTTLEDGVASKLKLLSGNTVFMEPAVCCGALKASEKLMQRVQATSADLDSDATASSSGGESGDEDSISPSVNPSELPALIKRAEWKWVMDRAAVVSRWTWLQAQVSDLEYRIRQQSQIYRQLRNSKGGVVLGDVPSTVDILRRFHELQPKINEDKLVTSSLGSEVSSCSVSRVMSVVDKQASRISQSFGKTFSQSSITGSPGGVLKNGLTESPCNTNTDQAAVENSPSVPRELQVTGRTNELLENGSLCDSSCQSARCRPLRSYRKRKILRTIGLYKTNSKAARLSDIRCRCYPPASSCPICGGRYNNTLTVDPDTMSLPERVALIDPSFHPVLSFPQDVHLSVHCEGLLKSGILQSKPLPRRRVGECKRQKVIALISEPVRKNSRQNGRNSAASVINFTTKIKQKYEGKGKSNVSSKGASLKSCLNRGKRKRNKAARVLKRNHLDDDDDLEALFLEQEASVSNIKENGLTCSSSQSSLKELREGHHRRRKVDNSFDINNIVIPLSMAASTRVEQPQYKEIVTPKWREILKGTLDNYKLFQIISDSQSTPVSETVQDEELEEDLSDEVYAARHLLLELEEKKRFRNFVQYPPVRRNRARSDAIPSTGRPMTGERVSTEEGNSTQPNLMDESSLSSLPTTPVLNKSYSSIFQNKNSDDNGEGHQPSSRRRTFSASRRERSSSIIFDDNPNSPDDWSGIKPWPRRTFPISESEYQLMVKEFTSNCEPVHHRSVNRRILDPSIFVSSSMENNEDANIAPSPHPSNESLSSAGDDPNDPEWIEISKRNKARRILNDDVNDPEWTGSDSPRKSKIKR